MRKDEIRRRLDKIEDSLTPGEVIASWIEEVNQFDTTDDYMKFVVERGGAPWSALEDRVRKGAENRSKAGGKAPSPESVRQCLSEACFERRLVVEMNTKVESLSYFAGLASYAIRGILGAVSQAVFYKIQVREMLRSSVRRSYGLDSSTAAAFVAAMARHLTGSDDFTTYLKRCVLRDSRAKAKDRAYQDLDAAVRNLCDRYPLNGFSVDLGVTPIAMLRNAPLVDGEWVDQVAIELAEFAKLLRARGMKIEPGEVSYFATAKALAQEQIAAVRAEVVARLSRFPGRTKQIGGRRYLHLDDYRAWPERKAGGSLPVRRGVITWAWNNLVVSPPDGAAAEIAGIRVGVLGVLGKDDGRTSSGGQPHNLPALHPLVTILRAHVGLAGALPIAASFISSLLIDRRAIEIAAERLGTRYFQGRQILFKITAKELKELLEKARSFANIYDEVAEAVEDVAFGFEGWRHLKIDFAEIEKAAQQQASDVVSEVVASSKMKMFFDFGETGKAFKVLEELLKKTVEAEASRG